MPQGSVSRRLAYTHFTHTISTQNLTKMKHKTTLSVLLLLLALCLLPQCRDKNVSEYSDNYENEIYIHYLERLEAILYDESLTQEELKDAIAPIIDSVAILARDDESLTNRLAAQMISYSVFNTLYDKFESESLAREGLSSVASSLLDAIGTWFYEVEEDMPILWHDMYYLSDKESDNPQDGYFHIMVLFARDDSEEAELHVFYPMAAEIMPYIAFTKFQEGTLDDDLESLVTIPFDNWYRKGEVDEGSPLYASAGQDIVEMMLTYDVMYLFFSRSQDPDDRSQYESARLSLYYFKQAYQEHIKDLEK